jgi:hypothetical protein
MPIPSNMLSADEIEVLLADFRNAGDLARHAFGGRPLTAEELERRRRSDEWWTERLRQMREREARPDQSV